MPLRRTSAYAVAGLLGCLAFAGPADAGFVPALGSPFATGTITRALAVGDADRNGTVDVVAGGLTLRRGDGTGAIGSVAPVGAPGPVEALAGEDLNGDGLRDYAAVASGTPRRVLQYAAVPGGGYIESTTIGDAGAASDVAIANVNGDGLADLIVVRADADPNVTVLLNLGGGAFVEGSYASGLPAPDDVIAADLTGDGRPELVVAGGGTNASVLLNAGDGTFASGDPFPTGAAGDAERLAVADFDGDGRLDLVATDSGGAPAVLALHGDGAGGMQTFGRRLTGLPDAPASIAAGDVNGDGAPDVVAGSAGGAFSVLLGDRHGEFAPAPGSPFPTGAPTAVVDDIAAVDMNRDGQLDVVAANRPGSVSVLLNADTGLMRAFPAEVGFGQMPAGSATQTRTVAFRAVRGRLRITRRELDGSSRFSVVGDRCVGRTLLLGQSCTMTVSFRPPRKAEELRSLLSLDANAAAAVVPFSATPRAPLVTAARVKPRRVRAGAPLTLRYRVSERARIRATVERALAGHRVGAPGERHCAAPRRANRRQPRCRRWEAVATVSRPAPALRLNRLRLRARAAGQPLSAGLYRIGISAIDRFRNRSDERYVKLRVLQAAAARPRVPK